MKILKSQIINDKIIRILSICILISMLVLGLSIFQDYGVSTDELIERDTGLVNLKFLLKNVFKIKEIPLELKKFPDLLTYRDRYYGVVLQMPMVLLEYINNFKFDISTVLKIRHMWTFLNYFTAISLFYLLILKRFNDSLTGLISIVILIILPRIFADSFYNIKDLLFLSWLIIGMFFYYLFLKFPSGKTSFVLAIVIALLANIRIIGLMLLGVACLSILWMMKKREISSKLALKYLFILLILCSLLTILFLPASWKNPISFFYDTIRHFSNFFLSCNELYFGKFINSTEVPWHYLLVWISVTTPIAYLILFGIGVIWLIFNNRLINIDELFDASILLMLTGSILAPILLKSTLYDGWRHFYFVYAFIIYLAIFGFYKLFNNGNNIIKIVLIIGLGFSFIVNGSWMIRNHPYQNVFFNVLARESAPYKFEGDYWGLSSKECLEFIVNQTNDERILVGDYDAVLLVAKYGLKKSDRDRIVNDTYGFEASKMKYVVKNYTSTIGNYAPLKFYSPIYKIQSDGMMIATVFERNDQDAVWANDVVKSINSKDYSEQTTKMIDGDLSTGWSFSSSQPSETSIEIELLNPVRIYGMSIFTETEKIELPDKLMLQYSENGVEWIDISFKYETHSDFAFDPVEANYLKLMFRTTNYNPEVTINEIMFHEYRE